MCGGLVTIGLFLFSCMSVHAYVFVSWGLHYKQQFALNSHTIKITWSFLFYKSRIEIVVCFEDPSVCSP